jgi:hypothetical protein
LLIYDYSAISGSASFRVIRVFSDQSFLLALERKTRTLNTKIGTLNTKFGTINTKIGTIVFINLLKIKDFGEIGFQNGGFMAENTNRWAGRTTSVGRSGRADLTDL